MKKLLTLILCCLLLSGCAKPAETSASESEPAVFNYGDLPGNLTGEPLLSPDGSTLYYCTPSQLRAWELSTGLHRLVKEMDDQVLTSLLLDGTVLQCTAGEDTFFLSARDGSLLYRGRGTYQITTEGTRYHALLPNALSVWGSTEGVPMLLTAQKASLPYDQQDLTDLRREAAALEAEYGITLLLGEEAALQPSLTPELAEPVLQQGLTALEQALAPFPPGLLKQTAAHFSGLTICLVRSVDTEGQFLLDGHAYIALSIGPDLSRELNHNLFHWMETHILTETSAFDRWETLNPAGFQYDFDFAANARRDAGVYLFEAHRCFVDTYSMSFPREDRARILEYAMESGKEGLFQPPAMQKKLQTLCAGIREAFSLEEEESFLWEQYLE